MGYDLCGSAPKTENGEYFNNTNLGWYPLWNYVCKTCSDFLTETDMEQGYYHSGYIMNEKSVKIAYRLFDLIESGAVYKEEVENNKKRSEFPSEECKLCNGTGLWEDKFCIKVCDACDGKGLQEPFEAMRLSFEENNMFEFAEFCLLSGGFSIG